jgi:hypothetical protein
VSERIPKGLLKDAKEIVELMAAHPEFFQLGRMYGFRIGITRELADLLKEHCGSAGELVAANCIEIGDSSPKLRM